MTIEQFANELKALLRKADNAGLDVDEFCEIAEYILAHGWEEDVP